jgi:hypothetical protein
VVPGKSRSRVEKLASETIRLGAEALEIEYKDGYEEVVVVKSSIGYGIARLRSGSRGAASLRDDLRELARRKRHLSVGGVEYELRCRVYDCFGEDAFRVDVIPLPQADRKRKVVRVEPTRPRRS